jgi:hypothetical protein
MTLPVNLSLIKTQYKRSKAIPLANEMAFFHTYTEGSPFSQK